MKHAYAILGELFAAAFTGGQSCSKFADCATRHDCPSDFDSVATLKMGAVEIAAGAAMPIV